jgi:hypothetical protein
MLDTFCRWAQQAITSLPAGVRAQLTLNAPSENSSARLDLDTPVYMGRVTCWNSGDFYWQILDMRSGRDVLDQHGKFEPAATVEMSLQPFLREFGKYNAMPIATSIVKPN